MRENNGYGKLIVKGGLVVAAGLAAIIYPPIFSWFAHPVVASLKMYHALWLLTTLILIKRMIPFCNKKMSSGKIFSRNFVDTGLDAERKRRGLKMLKGKTDSGAARSALYWMLLLAVMWFWRHVEILPDRWIYVIVIFFIFMDQVCVSLFCPFMWLMKNKCCSTCRINNWGYLMAFSPLVLIPSFWSYSIVLFSVISVIQWEFQYYRHPERFFDVSNANLMCRNCLSNCTRIRVKID